MIIRTGKSNKRKQQLKTLRYLQKCAESLAARACRLEELGQTTRPGFYFGPEIAEVLLSFARLLNEDASSKKVPKVLQEILDVAQQTEAEVINPRRFLDSMDPITRQPFINAFKFVFKALWESEQTANILSLIHISEPTRPERIADYVVGL